jgi:hypothetical protein
MNIATILLVLGILLALVSLLADVLGIGVVGLGWKQITGFIVGLVVAIVGGVLRSRNAASSQSP